MDTHGHEKQAQEVGAPLLEAALIRAEKHDTLVEQLGENYLGALYLGNWLTDVNQGIDPVAYHDARGKVMAAYTQLYTYLLQAYKVADRLLPGPVMEFLDPLKELIELLRGYQKNLDTLLTALDGGADSDVGQAITKVMRVKGYFKFVHPENPQDPEEAEMRLDFKVYDAIFKERFTQYFPHEHLDRWPDPNGTSAHKGYTTKPAKTTRASAQQVSPHIYEFLVADIEMTAGLFAEVDLWARDALAKNAKVASSDEEKLAWGMHLAKLGHALHACEDYFAHSNFIEHVYTGMADGAAKLAAFGIKEQDKDDPHSPWTLYTRRLTKVSGSSREQQIVTGTFDFQDTLHSLNHVAAELGATPAGAEGEAHRHPVERAATVSELMAAMSEGVRLQSRNNADEELSQALAERYAESVLKALATGSEDAQVRKLAAEIVAIHPDADDIRTDLIAAVAYMTKHPPGARDLSIYALLSSYLEMQAALIRVGQWVEDAVTGVIPAWMRGLLPNVVEALKNNTLRPIGEYIDGFLGRYRIGSHSLIAKDYEWHRPQYQAALDALYHRNWACSAAVHWYIVKTLVRWSEPVQCDVCLTPADDDRKANATVNTRSYLDWQDLLEFFLRHPHGSPNPEQQNRWWQPVVAANNWQAMPGYTPPTNAQRAAELAHQPDFTKTRADLDELKTRGTTLREKAEQFYNTSINLGPIAVPAPPPPLPPLTLSEGVLPPPETLEGVKKRLQMLGFYNGSAEPPFEEAAREATRQFQRQYGLFEDGIPGPATQQKLREIVGQ